MISQSNCLVVAGPSGVGKSTLISHALENKPDWTFSISATTRGIRPGETNGREYYFLEREQFETDMLAGKFLEYADVYGNLYGTPQGELERAANEGRHLLIEVDTVGCLSIRAIRPDIPLLAILPPNIAELKRRLVDRGTEDDKSLERRLVPVVAELQRMRSFDFALVNDDIELATSQLLAVMTVVEQNIHRANELVNTMFDQHKEIADA